MSESSQTGPAQTGPLAAGTLLQNRYLVQKLLGGGGMGVVYLAHDQRLSNRSCAIKEMVDHFIDPQQRLEANEYFAREADTLAQLKHVAIPGISDRFDDHNRHYLVMEYVEGRNLEEEMAAQGGPLSEGAVIDVGRQLCDVLSYLHGLSPPIVYRDMKPANVMLTPKGRVTLIDFGIARLFRGESRGTMIGTMGFAPPEQYQGQVDPRSDIYSLGATLHNILTGRDPEKFPPFSFPKIHDLRPGVSHNLAAAIDAALAYKVDNRPHTVQAFRDMMLYGQGLAATVSPKSGTAELPRTVVLDHPSAVRPRHRARRFVALALFSMVMAGVAFGATYVYFEPTLQLKLGVKPLIDSLPWKHAELVAKAREHPLEVESLSLQLSTRDGAAVSKPKNTFTDLELTNNQYLSWKANFINLLAGLGGRNEKIEARFYDPNGLQIAASDASRFVGPNQKMVDFGSVALIPNLADRPLGQYKVALYLGDQRLGEQSFSVTQDLAAKARVQAEAMRDAAEKAAAAKAEAEKQRAEKQRLAMLEERRAHPLKLISIRFRNSTKDGTPLSGAADSFNASKLLFIDWEVKFKNRLDGLESDQYRVDAAYIAPDGRTLGSVNDVKMVSQNASSATFSGRVGNSAGGAFLPGAYRVNFYLNGQYLTQKKFEVYSSRPATAATSPRSFSAPGGFSGSGPTLSSTTLADGTIDGLGNRSGVPLELRLRPQPNGFLHGELVIHEAGYGTTGIEGFVRGNHLQFQAPYGTETLYFEGQNSGGAMSGRFEASPSRSKGTWNATSN